MAIKKLIEVALPLEEINKASAREKSIRHGHPSTLHLWWARRPLAACRAVLFASIVDDPSAHPELYPTEELQGAERERLFAIIRNLVKWESTNNETVLRQARNEIMRATNGHPPPVLDPFCGGGSIPLEAQRLGLEAHGSDLNPVAVLITKALIEIPPKFSGQPPMNPEAWEKIGASSNFHGAQGLAEDVRYYGKWMRDEARKRIGHLYPKVRLSSEHGGEATVIAWLWVRTVTCPNPACAAQMPLVRSFALSARKANSAWVDPIIDRTKTPPEIQFNVRTEHGIPRDGTVNRRGATCICCGTAVPFDHVRAEGRGGRMQVRLMAIIAEQKGGRVYVTESSEHASIAVSEEPAWKPDADLPHNPRDFKTPNYGMTTFADLFTSRQLVALTTFSDLVAEARDEVLRDCIAAGLIDDGVRLSVGGNGATAYADAVATYLAFCVDRGANYWSSLTPWGGEFIVQTFGRQALPMVWDFAEANPFSSSTGNWIGATEWIAKCLEISVPTLGNGSVIQADAAKHFESLTKVIICTDPPYYDNIGYADLSDYFYIWLRRSLGNIYPDLFRTMLVPKEPELVATPYRFAGDKHRAEEFFENGLAQAFQHMSIIQSEDYPLTLFYAFKQAETDDSANDESPSFTSSTGWETMLTGVIGAGFQITGTWPMRTERDQGLKSGSNFLASSIVLVCRPRPDNAPVGERREFRNSLRDELKDALRKLQHGNIAPVDLAQAAIGPGMAIFSRYEQVLEPDGTPMRVRTALQLINEALDEVLAEQEGDYDAETRWAVAWYEQYGMDEGTYGSAETLSRAKNASVDGLVASGIVKAGQGKVRLLRREELPLDWNPVTDKRLTVWEVAQYLIRTLENDGEDAAAALLARCGAQGDVARELAYRLYVSSERKGWTQEAFSYNGLVIAWPDLTTKMRQQREEPKDEQTALPLV